MARMLVAATMVLAAFLQVQAMQVQDLQELQVHAVPLGEVVITHAGLFSGEYLYATQDDDGQGGRFVHTMNGSLRDASEDPQARWNISQVGGSYVITHAGSFKGEYLFVTRTGDSLGGSYVHTWTKNSLNKDPQARWNISKVGWQYVITHASSFTGSRATNEEILCATQLHKSNGRRVVHAIKRGQNDPARVPGNDPHALWRITPVATSVGGPAADSKAESKARYRAIPHDGHQSPLHGARHHGARAWARERALAKRAAEEVASAGCVNLGGDRWFADANARLFQVSQDGCSITFSLKTSSGELYEDKGVVSGYEVRSVDDGEVLGHVLPNQTVVFENGARWELKWP